MRMCAHVFMCVCVFIYKKKYFVRSYDPFFLFEKYDHYNHLHLTIYF